MDSFPPDSRQLRAENCGFMEKGSAKTATFYNESATERVEERKASATLASLARWQQGKVSEPAFLAGMFARSTGDVQYRGQELNIFHR